MWTNPLTWTDDQLVTPTQMNTHVRDNLLYLKANPVLVEASVAKGAANVSSLAAAATAVSSDVGAVYVEAWGHFYATDPGAGHNNVRVYINEASAGELVAWCVYGWASISYGPFYLRTGDLAWAGSTRTVSLAISTDVPTVGFNTTGAPGTGQSDTSEVRIRMVRSY